jgi:uncharacterized protein (DUF1697 family)
MLVSVRGSVERESAARAAVQISRTVQKTSASIVRCIALLRGINVSGRKTVNMTDLKRVFKELGFGNVRTHGQSGNVIFDCGRAETATLATRVEEKLSEAFGFSINVIIRTQQELEKIIETNPLVDSADVAREKLYVTFLANVPDKTATSKLDITPGADEKFAIVGSEVYLYCPNGYAQTKLNNAAFETKLDTIATTRGWNVIIKVFSKLVEGTGSIRK